MRVKDETKIETIFKASLQVMEKEGIAGATMAKIAKQAKLATGTLYIYFKNKEDLISALYLELRKQSSERFLRDYDPHAPFVICLKKVWMNYLKHRIEHHEESIFLEQYYHSPYITTEQKKTAQAMKQPILKLISRGKDELIIRKDIDDEMLFSAMIGFIRELADEYIDGNYKLNNEKLESAFKLTWDMVKA